MITASSLLLLTLVVNVPLHSPTPIPATAVAVEPGPEGLGQVQNIVLADAGEVAPSPEGSPAVNDVLDAGEVPVLTVEPVPSGPEEAEAQESDPREVLSAAPQEYSKDDDDLDASQEEEVDEVESPDFQDVEDQVPIAPTDPLEDGAPGEHLKDADFAETEPDVKSPPKTPEQENPDVLVPEDAEMKEAAEEKYVVEETGPEEPALLVLGDPADQGPEEKTVNRGSSDTNEAEEHSEEEHGTFFMEENIEEDPSVEEPEENSVVLIPVEPAAEEEAAVLADPSEDAIALVLPVEPEKTEGDTEAEPPAASVLADVVTTQKVATATHASDVADLGQPTTEGPAPGDLMLIVTQEPVEGRGNNDPDEGHPDVVSVTEATSDPRILDHDVLFATVVASVDSVTSPAAAVTHGWVEGDPTSVEGVSVADTTTHGDDFEAAGVLTDEESAALATRGAVLGAAFSTLVCLITLGFAGAFLTKKLRRLHDTEAKIV